MGLTEKLILLGVGMILIIVIAVIIYNRNDTRQQLKEEYEVALKGMDRTRAVEAGKAYYKFLRGNELTIEDERIILKETAHIEDQGANDQQKATGIS
jgi:hypothetical protein